MSHHLGLNIGEDLAEIVQFIREGQDISVKAISEWSVSATLADQALRERLDGFIRENAIKARSISVSLSTSRIIIHTFPAEAGTNHQQWTTAARWELSKILPGKRSEGYITDAIALPPPPGRSGVEVLSISLRRSDVALLESAAGFCGLKVSSIDADIFCAETLYLERTPGGPPPASLIVAVRKDRIDWTRLSGRVTVRYGTQPLDAASVEDVIGGILPTLGALDKIVLHGDVADPATAATLQTRHGIAAECINPFTTMAVPASILMGEHFKRNPHRFTAAAGAALRAGD
jgi:Tfp pilus assembly PilM family ATPase